MRATYTRLLSHSIGPSLIYLMGRVLPSALQMLGVTVFFRLLGPAEYGRYALVTALTLLVGNVAATWLTQSVLRYRSAHAGSEQALAFDGALRWGLRGSMGAALVVLATVLVFRSTDAAGLACALLAAASLLRFSVVYAERQAVLQPGAIFGAEALRGMLTFAVPLGLVGLVGWHHYAPLLLGIAAGNAAGTRLLRRAVPRETLRFGPPERALLGQFARFGGPLTVWMGVSILLNVSDRFVIEQTLGAADVGAYAAVYDVVYKATNLLLTPLLLAAHPLIMRAWNAGHEAEARHLVRRTEGLTLLLGVALVAVWWGAAPLVANVFLVGQAPEAERLVVPVALGAVAWSLAMVTHKPLEMRERTGLMCAFAGVALAAQVTVNLALLPRYGLVVAAWTTFGSAVLYLVCVGAFSALNEAEAAPPVPSSVS